MPCVEAYRRALLLDPKNDWARYHRANLLAEIGKRDEALADYLVVARSRPDVVFAFYNLSCLYALGGKRDEALAALEEALKKGYRNFTKARNDSDLTLLRGDPRFDKLLGQYEQRSQARLSPETTYQTARPDERQQLLLAEAPSVGVLRLAVRDLNATNRQLALLAFDRLGTDESTRELLLGLCDHNQGTGKIATKLLIGRGVKVLPLVRPLLDTKAPFGAFFAAQIVSLLRDRSSVPKLRELLNVSIDDARLSAAISLGSLDAVEALPEIEQLLKRWTRRPGHFELFQVVEHLRARSKVK